MTARFFRQLRTFKEKISRSFTFPHLLGTFISFGIVASGILISYSLSAAEFPHHPDPVQDEPWQGDIRRFQEHDFDLWRRGSWLFGLHNGQSGWWWVLGHSYYYYASPVYPYPDPFRPFNVEPVGGLPNLVTTSPVPTWFYCESPRGYYPYVTHCVNEWHREPAHFAPLPGQVMRGQAAVAAPPGALYVTTPSRQSPPLAVDQYQIDIDNTQLISYKTNFDSVDLKSPNSRVVLHDLQRQVDVFRQSLSLRNYDTTHIVAETAELQNHIVDLFETLSVASPPSGKTPQSVALPQSTVLAPLQPSPQSQSPLHTN